ncbi:type ISP restriction/modification enzyme [Bogoriella caseilytica]|uniref:site-specific DNA-methyltransferase (adenine-specific) n=1 Tax=Bogoriella caseilytica TaxID=56055 RepID=A0A3N2BGR6_9MICO|nr:type ISP restriction/modification enzyme [Bogoriella caseilytica]ROR74425.1 N-6 DNA methylase [Bogoriella caseilytica]
MAQGRGELDPIKVFVSYKKHDDPERKDGAGRAFLDDLAHEIEQRATDTGVPVELWYDRQLAVGERWDDEIKTRLREADLYVAVYSPGFFDNNGYIARHELPVMVRAARDRRPGTPARVLTISRKDVRPEDIPDTYRELSDLQAANEGRPVEAEDPDTQARIVQEFARSVLALAQRHYDARRTTQARPVIEDYRHQVTSHLHDIEMDERTSPEDPLKAPVKTLIENVAALLPRVEANVSFEARTTSDDDVSGVRLDLSVKNTRGLLIGHVELKSPRKSADPTDRKGWSTHDRQQWEQLAGHPNLIYSNGLELVHLQRGYKRAEVALDPEKSLSDAQAAELVELIGAFLRETPTAPRSPRALADRLAPLTRLLRDKVVAHLKTVDESNGRSPLAGKYAAWQQTLMPSATVEDFADAFAQCYTYALLIARFENALSLPLDERQLGSALRAKGHELLGDVLSVMVGPQTKEVLSGPLGLIEALVAHVDPEALTKTRNDGRHQDPWLYFYEDFLAAYDPARREEAGVYYTPLPVVGAQVRLVEHALRTRHGVTFSSENVTVLDPALGTGTYLLQTAQHVLDATTGGSNAPTATSLARRLHGFELMVGSYAVAHLRLTQALTSAGADLGNEGVKVFLTDTLTAPLLGEKNPGQLALLSDEAQAISHEQQRSSAVKRHDTPIRVIIGNPPYSRGSRAEGIGGLTDDARPNIVLQAHNTGEGDKASLLEDFTKDTPGGQVKNLYNSYVYFWRWAIWKACEQRDAGPGIVSFITSSSFLRGPGFAGMRKHMRERFEELWIIDLGGEGRGAHKEENVFAIQTPVAIVTGIQRQGRRTGKRAPATVRYHRIDGTASEKLATLDTLHALDEDDTTWQIASKEWTASFIPEGAGEFFTWPSLLDIFPWQHSGAQYKRKWPIAASPETLSTRWEELYRAGKPDGGLFRETGDRKVSKPGVQDVITGEKLPAFDSDKGRTSMMKPIRYGYRSFDRQWCFPDARMADRMRPELWQSYSNRQLYITTLTSTRLGTGPVVTVSAHVPDLDFFRGSFGAKNVIPLYRDFEATTPNITSGLLDTLTAELGTTVTAEDLAAYAFALTGTGAFYERFKEDLTESGARLPLTKDTDLFTRTASFGRGLLALATFGERFRTPNRYGAVEPWTIHGQATLAVATPPNPEAYPERFSYDDSRRVLKVGDGEFHSVAPEVWNYQVSGMPVVKSWLGYRMKNPAGKSSSPLDKIQAERWEFDLELLELLRTLEQMLAAEQEAASLLDQITASDLFTVAELPEPADWERKPRKKTYRPVEAQDRFDL